MKNIDKKIINTGTDYYNDAIKLRKHRVYKTALDYINNAIDLDYDNPEFHHEKALILTGLYMHDESAKSYKEAIRMYCEHVEDCGDLTGTLEIYLLSMISSLNNSDQNQELLQYLNCLLVKFPECSLLLSTRAATYTILGKEHEAEGDFCKMELLRQKSSNCLSYDIHNQGNIFHQIYNNLTERFGDAVAETEAEFVIDNNTQLVGDNATME